MGKLIKLHKDQESRCIAVEMRAVKDGRRIEGYAALVDTVTDMGWYNETIAAGAFDDADLSDVRCLFNHDPDRILARTVAGTLSLKVDERGLFFSFEAPDTTDGNDLVENVRLRNISEASFAFRVEEQTWTETEDEPDLRTITKIKVVYDVAPVTYAAYPDTDVALRSRPSVEEDDKATDSTSEEQPAGFDDEVRQTIQIVNQRLNAAS